MAVLLIQPSSTRSAANPEGGGLVGTSSTPKWYLKVWEHTPTYSTKLAETTGDGDKAVQYEQCGLCYAQGTLRGAMLTNQAVGLTNFVSATADARATLAFHWGRGTTSHRKVSHTAIVDWVRVHWRKNAAIIPVTIHYHLTGTSGSTIETTYT